MKHYLIFRLYGALASWGQAAVGGDRATGLQPTRSAILGLLGAALGIKRDQEQALENLQNSIQVAIKQCVPSSLIRDFHTAQVPSHNKKRTHYSRRSELAECKLNTVLSSRDYRCDGLWIVALSARPSAPITLAELHQALQTPVYTLSLGRKSCPLGAPLAPQLRECEHLQSALDSDFPPLTHSHQSDAFWLGANKSVTYFWEGDIDEFDSQGVITTEPWDEPINKERWQFKQRRMHQLTLQEQANVSV